MRDREPAVAVVITVKDDPRVIDCVRRILDQDTPFGFSVVVVDNGSTDETPDLLEQHFGDDERVQLASIEGNLSAAWNGAARSSGAEVLARIDADAYPEPGWLKALVQPILDGDAGWTAGPVRGVEHENLVERYFHHRTETYCRRLEADPELRPGVPSWNVAYTREALEQAGWYDPWQASSVDWDLHKRIYDAGVIGRYVPDAWIRHHHPRSLSTFARKEAWYRTGHYQMMLKYGPGTVAATFVLPGAYALAVALLIGGLVEPLLAWVGLGLIALYVVKHAVGGIREDDPMWWARTVFRPTEAFAGLYGLVRGLWRYGLKRRVPPGPST